MAELPDTSGLICGFRLRAGERPEPLDARFLAQPLVASDAPVWLHFNLSDTRAQAWLAACEVLPPAARNLLLGEDNHVQIQTIAAGLCGVLADLHYEFEADPECFGQLRFYVDRSSIITGRQHPLKSVDRLRRDMIGGKVVATPFDLLVQLVEDLAEMFAAVTLDQGDLIDDIEDRILKVREQFENAEVGRVRRLVSRLRRHVGAERQALSRVAQRLPAGWSEEESSRLRWAVERLDGIAQDLESIQERGRLLQEEMAGRLAEATNRNLYILSIVTVVFAPITLLTGVFGMNVGGLPWLENTVGFWWVAGFITLTIFLTLILLRWRRFL